MTTKEYKVWRDERKLYHRYYGPAVKILNQNTFELEDRWFIHGIKIK